jgi:hypothetical protein
MTPDERPPLTLAEALSVLTEARNVISEHTDKPTYDLIQDALNRAPVAGPLHIEARRWFQRLYGNTYHSVRIFSGGKLAVVIPFEYGYGEQWLQTAYEWLIANGIAEPGSYGTQHLREVLHGTYSVIDVTRKGDL